MKAGLRSKGVITRKVKAGEQGEDECFILNVMIAG
jgi:hypothetical protein